MTKDSPKWVMNRKNAMDQLARAREEGKADEGIRNLVDKINSNPDLYTTSSCSGRICLLETPKEHSKLESRWLYKTHSEAQFDDVLNVLEKNKKEIKNTVYLQAECPILHVVAKELDSAKKILFLALQSGFKRSGIQSIQKDRIVIEICSTETLEVPIAEAGEVLVKEDYLRYLVDIANMKWRRGQEKLKRFCNLL